MLEFPTRRVVSIGEAMIEMAPVGGGLYRRGFAGDAYNTIWHMKQVLGAQSNAGFLTCIGRDRLSDEFATELAADGLDVSTVARDSRRLMGLYLIELDGAERSFHYWRRNSAAGLLADDPKRLENSLRDAGLVHLSGITLAILTPEARGTLFRALAQARRTGTRVSFDPNIRPRLWSSLDEIRATVSAMLALADIALPSFDDESSHWNDTAPENTIRRCLAAGVAEVVVKNGAGRIHYHADGRDGDCETPAVQHVRDTTGAGDAFNAGYLSARLMGARPERAIAAGQRLAAEVIQHIGARLPQDKAAALAPFILDHGESAEG